MCSGSCFYPEKKLQRTEKKGINREKSAATERNEIIERLTRAPVVLHPKGDFGDLLGGPVDIILDNVTMELGGLIMLDVSFLVIRLFFSTAFDNVPSLCACP